MLDVYQSACYMNRTKFLPTLHNQERFFSKYARQNTTPSNTRIYVPCMLVLWAVVGGKLGELITAFTGTRRRTHYSVCLQDFLSRVY